MKFIRKYLKATDLATDRQSVKKFVHKFLGYDGVFCMRMISAHAGDIMATELIVALWHNFNDRLFLLLLPYGNVCVTDLIPKKTFTVS